MPEDVAHRVHRWVLVLVVGAAVVTGASLVLDEVGVGHSTFLVVYSLTGVYFVLALLALIWTSRQPVAAALLPAERGGGGGRVLGLAGALLALAGFALYVIVHGGLLDLGRDARRRRPVVRLILSLFVIPVAIGIDIWGQRLIRLVSGELTEVVDLSGDRVREIPPDLSGEGLQDLCAADPAPVPAGAGSV